MNLLSLAAIPAATHVARDAVAGSVQVSKSFFSLLANLTNPGTPSQSDDDRTADVATATADMPRVTTASLTEHTSSFSQRLTKWLRQQPELNGTDLGDGPLSIQLSLDHLDRPQARLSGEAAEQLNTVLNEVLSKDPQWLDEFRELALDRIEQMGPVYSNSPFQSLTIDQESATMDAEHRWN